MKRGREADILGRLDGFSADGKKLPVTVVAGGGRKVNVKALCRELGLKGDDAQHFHNKEVLKSAVNALASLQGLLGIGEREAVDPAERRIEERIRDSNAAARSADMASEEAAAAMAALVEELKSARAEIVALRADKASLEAQLRLVEETGFLWDAGRGWP